MRLTDEVIGLRAELAEARSRLDQAELKLSENAEYYLTQARLLEESKLTILQVTRERDALLRLEQEFSRLHRELREIHKSWTWRLGRFVLLPVRVLRRLKRILIRN